MANHIVIMAGGIGSRFWPMSTPEKPKQFIDITGCGRTMIQQTVDRFGNIAKPENIWVVTSKKYASLVKEQLPFIPEQNILLEPCMRNTTPCIAYVSARIRKADPEANLVITPSDHLVANTSEFQRIISEGLEFAAQNDAILTLGMNPTRPETGYGYIESSKEDTADIKKVVEFKEKPNLETAKQYIQKGTFYWNSGLFIWSNKTIDNALRKYAADIVAVFDNIYDVLGTEKEQEVIDIEFPKCRAISIDFAVMENADNVYVLPSEFGWSDLGTWGSLHTIVESDENKNSVIGNNVRVIESSNCMIHLPDDKKVVLQGLDGFIVAEQDGVLMICKMDQEQRIKEFSNGI